MEGEKKKRTTGGNIEIWVSSYILATSYDMQPKKNGEQSNVNEAGKNLYV